jgi:hypothetical protein
MSSSARVPICGVGNPSEGGGEVDLDVQGARQAPIRSGPGIRGRWQAAGRGWLARSAKVLCSGCRRGRAAIVAELCGDVEAHRRKVVGVLQLARVLPVTALGPAAGRTAGVTSAALSDDLLDPSERQPDRLRDDPSRMNARSVEQGVASTATREAEQLFDFPADALVPRRLLQQHKPSGVELGHHRDRDAVALAHLPVRNPSPVPVQNAALGTVAPIR